MIGQAFHVLVAVAAFAASASGQAAGRLTAVAGPATSGVTLALTPAEYNNTVADLLGFPRDGKRWPERSALADKLSHA